MKPSPYGKYTKQKEHIETKEYTDYQDEEYRAREIWEGGQLQDWDGYLKQEIQKNATKKQEYYANAIDQRKHSKEENASKQLISEIRQHWENEYIKIITKEIQDGQKNGNARIVFKR